MPTRARSVEENGSENMNKCDWIDCSETRLFDGANKILLNAEGRKNVDDVFLRFVFLCPNHFKLGVGRLAQKQCQKETGTETDA